MSILVLQSLLMGKRELIALLNLSSWCFMMVEQLFLAVPRGCLRFVIVVFSDHTHYFLRNTGPDPLKNRKATRPEFNVRPSSGRQQNAI